MKNAFMAKWDLSKSSFKGENGFLYLLNQALQTAFKRFNNKLTMKHNIHVIINTNGNK